MQVLQTPTPNTREQLRAAALSKLVNEDWLAKDWNQRGLIRYVREYGDPLDHFRTEGYWRSAQDYSERLKRNPNLVVLPFPEENSWTVSESKDFLELLDFVEAQLVRRKLRMSFLGHSECRVCGKLNGSMEFFFEGWKWPAGFRHYVEDHLVKPTDHFISFIENLHRRLSNPPRFPRTTEPGTPA